jgi:hypothetical protein
MFFSSEALNCLAIAVVIGVVLFVVRALRASAAKPPQTPETITPERDVA